MEKGKGVSPSGSKRSRHLPAFILLFLARDGDLHGGALNNLIKSLWPRDWYRESFDAGAVYRMLRNMEETGAVTSRWETGASVAPRRICRITGEGRRMLGDWEKDITFRRNNLQFFSR